MIILHPSWAAEFGLPDQVDLRVHRGPHELTKLPIDPKVVWQVKASGSYSYYTSLCWAMNKYDFEILHKQDHTTDTKEWSWIKALVLYIHGLCGELTAEALVRDVKECATSLLDYIAQLASVPLPYTRLAKFEPLTFHAAMEVRSVEIGARFGGPTDMEGLCPKCGERGRYSHCVPVCSKHGPYN